MLRYAPDVADLVAHLDHQARNSPILRRSKRTARLVVAVAFAAVAAMLWQLPGDLPAKLRSLGAASVGLVFVIVVAPRAASFLRRWIWRRTLDSSRGAHLRAWRTLELEPEGMRVKSPKGETFTPWEGIYEVIELPTVVLLQVGPMAAHVIPLRAFADENERATFVAEVRSHLVPGVRASSSARV